MRIPGAEARRISRHEPAVPAACRLGETLEAARDKAQEQIEAARHVARRRMMDEREDNGDAVVLLRYTAGGKMRRTHRT